MDNIKRLMDQILKLSIEDRIRLATDIWASLAGKNLPSSVSPARIEELERRVRAWQQNPTGGLSLEEWEHEHFAGTISSARKAELDRRIADHEANPGTGHSWEEVKKELRH